MTNHTDLSAAGLEQRTAALEAVFQRKGNLPDGFVDDFSAMAGTTFVTANGARMVARAWTDPDYRARMLQDGTGAAREMGFEFPAWHQKLTVLENTDKVHNVIVCTLCSCTAYSIIGGAPGWYKEFEYRSRLVRESRTVLKEMGLDIADDVELRVWDTTADTRYMVLPLQPPETVGWSAEDLAGIVTQDAMIGVAPVASARS
ncbi:nitrile hydratase subunit alpha [Enterovirga rhinocerotis]|uniref:Nitrile hydratase n=1 Tax=Enterovirga rhinocerotis TaxID=1339210 RepID=A0A4R7C811_9HYPH|nr:nitrile hydratase subunit alpha [Enterovirga rhinocerotis]TDR92976.1 nitrile hydratase [Enterovirga rhinocerotis]